MMAARQSPYSTNQQEINISNIAALLGSFPPQMGNIANLMPNPALSMIATSSSSSGGQPVFLNQATVSLPYGAIDPATAMAFIQQQQQQQLGQPGLWSHGGDKQQQQLMAAIAAQQHQQLQHQQQQYELLQSLGYVNPAAYALTNNGAPNGQGTAALGKQKLDNSSTTTTAVCNNASVSTHQPANGSSSLVQQGPTIIIPSQQDSLLIKSFFHRKGTVLVRHCNTVSFYLL
uniref:Uncharacterized protein n=1 Tax=Ditylenchus dipsaci TaxID=166011 RepID=A0A915D1A3_9BILA